MNITGNLTGFQPSSGIAVGSSKSLWSVPRRDLEYWPGSGKYPACSTARQLSNTFSPKIVTYWIGEVLDLALDILPASHLVPVFDGVGPGAVLDGEDDIVLDGNRGVGTVFVVTYGHDNDTLRRTCVIAQLVPRALDKDEASVLEYVEYAQRDTWQTFDGAGGVDIRMADYQYCTRYVVMTY